MVIKKGDVIENERVRWRHNVDLMLANIAISIMTTMSTNDENTI